MTWNTSDLSGASPNLLRTPKPPSFGSNNVTNSGDLDFLANAQHLLATPDFSALPIGSSFDGAPKEENSQTITQPALSLDTTVGSQSSGNIQTPPPTTTSATKRQGKKAQVIQSSKDTDSPSSSRRKSVPILPKPTSSGNLGAIATEASPGDLGLDFSPADFGWAPATAPAYPQQKLFWETEDDGSMNLDMQNVSFGNTRSGLEAFVSTHPSVSTSQRTITDDYGFGEDHTPLASFASAVDNFDEQLNQSLQAVNPSVLYSSSDLNDNVTTEDAALQPYAHQLQEARRERAYGGIAKLKKRRKPSVDSPAVRAAMEQLREDAPRPALQRSMTDTALSRTAQDIGSSRTSSAHGRSSPVKAVRAALKQQKRQHRTSIALTIDEHGRARAESRARPNQEEAMDIDSESESSYTASSVDEMGAEMVASFSRPSGPKLGQFGKPSNHSQKSSTASFYSTASHYDLQGGQSGMATSNAQKAILEDESEAETVLNSEDDEDFAQSELRKTMQGRQQRPTTHHLYSPQGASTAFFPNTDFANLSPSTIPDPELPSYSNNSPGHSEIRCLCSSAMDDGNMIQW